MNQIAVFLVNILGVSVLSILFYQSVNTKYFLLQCVFVLQDPSNVHVEPKVVVKNDEVVLAKGDSQYASEEQTEVWTNLHALVENKKKKVSSKFKQYYFCKICGYYCVAKCNLVNHLKGKKQNGQSLQENERTLLQRTHPVFDKSNGKN